VKDAFKTGRPIVRLHGLLSVADKTTNALGHFNSLYIHEFYFPVGRVGGSLNGMTASEELSYCGVYDPSVIAHSKHGHVTCEASGGSRGGDASPSADPDIQKGD